ncbi:hypothetical protein ASE07_20760 [Noviherbaspirillum sp. Root189]|nr:hypothetical protein ASE07_20760 [Noviherbaspirillum sp. Root189]
MAKSFISNQVRSGKNGLILTCSGRTIPEPPYALIESSRQLTLYDQWLVSQAQQEAEVNGDEVLHARLLRMDENPLNEEVRELLHDYLFGESTPCFGIEVVVVKEDKKE